MFLALQHSKTRKNTCVFGLPAPFGRPRALEGASRAPHEYPRSVARSPEWPVRCASGGAPAPEATRLEKTRESSRQPMRETREISRKLEITEARQPEKTQENSRQPKRNNPRQLENTLEHAKTRKHMCFPRTSRRNSKTLVTKTRKNTCFLEKTQKHVKTRVF